MKGLRVSLFLVTFAWLIAAPAAAASKKKEREALRDNEARAQRLCDAFHTIPAERKGACCGAAPSSLARLCAQSLGASLDRGAVTIEDVAIDRCKEAVSKQLEGCGWVSPVAPPLPDACRGVVRGLRKIGERCRSSIECFDGLACLGAGPEREGICAAPTKARARCEVPADDAVAFTRADASRHPTCEGLCIKGVCVPFSPSDGPCQSSAACAGGLHCIAGRCQDKPLPAIGEPCPGGTSCGAGAHCQEGTCVALKDAGESCKLPTECRSFECAKGPGEALGKCGDPCGHSQGVRRSD